MIARVCNCISLLGRHFVQISEHMVNLTIESSLLYPVVDLLLPEIGDQIVAAARQCLEEENKMAQ